MKENTARETHTWTDKSIDLCFTPSCCWTWTLKMCLLNFHELSSRPPSHLAKQLVIHLGSNPGFPFADGCRASMCCKPWFKSRSSLVMAFRSCCWKAASAKKNPAFCSHKEMQITITIKKPSIKPWVNVMCHYYHQSWGTRQQCFRGMGAPWSN